ncbi:uncharacterized protein G2W53_040892 [Senna tora]|uniref:Uncharacterized protein n=1 Tax=Senna tora TaxID=362788 RepID=A0A834SEA1_9FABA|nr:uncharacterized protein G2W53_040892 [Senna tora]
MSVVVGRELLAVASLAASTSTHCSEHVASTR